MKVLVAPNSMKGSIDAFSFARAVKEGLNDAGIEDIVLLPLADGGDGTSKVLSEYYKGEFVPVDVLDPLFREIKSGYYSGNDRTAIIEMADASGLKLLRPNEYSAINCSSFGTGQLIKSAIDRGATTIIIGVGGSATVDGGMGALMALGVRFFDKEGEIRIGCGKNMGNVISIDLSEVYQKIKAIRLLFLADIVNPLLGVLGAARYFGPQKGATAKEIEVLEKNMALFSGAIFQTTGKDISTMEGGGAAGGITASFHALLGAGIIKGASFVMGKAKFDQIVKDVDLIITGEGEIDESTFKGKVPGEVLKIGTSLRKPVYAICGSTKLNYTNGFIDIVTLVDFENDQTKAMENAFILIKKIAYGLMKKDKFMDEELNKAEMHFSEGRPKEALLILNPKIKKDHFNLECLTLRAKIYYHLQNWGEALNDLNLILENDPNNQMAQNYKLMINDIVTFWNKDNFNP
jgi:glycerate 2-kinase